MCCFKVFCFKILFPLAIFNFIEDLGKEQGVYSTALSCAFHCIFQLKTWDSTTTPAAGPFLGDCMGPAAWKVAMPQTNLPFSQKVLSPKPKRG